MAWLGLACVVSIVTRYGLESLGMESQYGVRFSAPIQTGPNANPATYTMVTGSFPGVKRPESGIDHSPPYRAEVKERVEVYLYCTYRSLCPVLG